MSPSMSMPTLLLILAVFCGASLPMANGSTFLRKSVGNTSEDMSLATERDLLDQLEQELGSHHRKFSERRLRRCKDALRPLFTAMPKNTKDKLDLPSVSYVLRRAFAARHAWFVKGLEPESNSMAAFQHAEPTKLLGTSASSLFQARFAEGMGLEEVAVLMATLEHKIHKESSERLALAYRAARLSTEDGLTRFEVEQVIETYLVMYILGLAVDGHEIDVDIVRSEVSNIETVYEEFPQTQAYARAILDTSFGHLSKSDNYYFSEVMQAVEEIEDGYGKFQNEECLSLKKSLTSLEAHQGVTGAGRVRVVDFYNAALHHGQWQFAESVDHLREMGALDESDPNDLKIIIPNYINGPTNCLASTSYYQVCCIDECNSLFGHLEGTFASHEASPAQILAAIRGLPSSSVPGNRTLSPWIEQRLQEVAEHHGGVVPLHGRLFTQWMHYAYPRECIYPGVLGQTSLSKQDTVRPEADVTAMQEFVAAAAQNSTLSHATSADKRSMIEAASIEGTMWKLEEELFTVRPNISSQQATESSWLRSAMLLLLAGSVSTALVQSLTGSDPKASLSFFNSKESPFTNEKHFV